MPSTTSRGGPGRRRADAERSIAAITAAARDCLLADPGAGMSAVARAAGVSRVTLYSHFPSREELLEAVVEHAVGETAALLADQRLEDLPADQALTTLARSSWQYLDRHLTLFSAVSTALPPDRMRARHAQVLTPLHELLLRGQAEGTIRDDLPADWLVTVYYHLIHAAAAEAQAGRLSADTVPDLLTATLLPAVRQPRT
ncbi:TetR/AcrR family transcriptional regulator [Streptomyces sp. B6B3]|uniref:TetR/AcrR family transcriptional regulator n=1 Tax=Streptomyces sp. B6B3 TaxID=3153570 RepID=UPI00325E1F79